MKLRHLARGEEGVAMATTLALLLFMYLVCAGAYAVGAAAKERAQLQNACDAAAYSAAVVQADTLSRIATLNRAMSWTYAQVTKRQMDWIVHKWTVEAAAHWRQDCDNAREWASHSTLQCDNPSHLRGPAAWDCSSITLRGATRTAVVSADTLESAAQDFMSNHERAGVGTTGASFYAPLHSADERRMKRQIQEDWENIRAMGEEIDDLAQRYRRSAKDAAEATLKANLANLSSAKLHIDRHKDWSIEPGDLEACLEDMEDSDASEAAFLAFSQCPPDVFGAAGRLWFTRISAGGHGFLRGFADAPGLPAASWSWRSVKWRCYYSGGAHRWIHRGPYYTSCIHGHEEGCRCVQAGTTRYRWNATCLAGNSRSRNPSERPTIDCYVTPEAYRARPRILSQRYFGREGTATVALAVENVNLWPVLTAGTAQSDIYSAFNPFVRKTVCLASAKAGYKPLPFGKQEYPEYERGYRIDWDSGDGAWNLCQNDWDAVLLPVRRAASTALDGRWIGSPDGAYIAERLAAAGAGAADAVSGGIDRPWQIGRRQSPVRWDGLERLMLH